MRWDELFADLEGRLVEEDRREFDSEVADRTRRERALVDLLARLAGHEGPLRLALAGGRFLDCSVSDLGADWLLVDVPARGTQALVPVAAIRFVEGLGRRAVTTRTARRFGWGYAVRALARDRATVTITDVDGGAVTGTIDVVGADYLDLAAHASDEVRRERNVRGSRSIPIMAVAVIESRV